MSSSLISRTVFLVVILILAICCCMTWILQVEKCKRINYQKFQIIAQLEQKLPARVLSWESSIKPEADAKKDLRCGKSSLSDYEKNLALVFCVAITLIVLIMLVKMWWIPLCELIR